MSYLMRLVDLWSSLPLLMIAIIWAVSIQPSLWSVTLLLVDILLVFGDQKHPRRDTIAEKSRLRDRGTDYGRE